MSQKIVIIGAGPSGIAAATKLIEHGFTDLTILEAEPRIGGRVNTVPFGAGVIELGAQYCHGIKNNAVYDLAKAHNVLHSKGPLDSIENLAVCDTNGTPIPIEKSRKLFQLANRILESGDMQSYKGSLGSFFMEKYWEALKDKLYDDIDEKQRFQFSRLYHKCENAVDATDTWYLTSCRAGFEDEPGPGENLIWNANSKGYATIFDLLQKKFPGQGEAIDITTHLQLNKVVQKISYSLSSSPTTIQIECADGSTYNAQHLICTVSLGVLKERHYSLFDPILPQKKIDTIESLTFGVLGKILLEFERPFWPAEWTGYFVYWSPEQLKLIREKHETRWLENITNFQLLDGQPNIIFAWVAGAEVEELPTEKVVEHTIMLLKMLLKDFNVPDAPKNAIRSQWFSNPNFRGSYSSVSVEADAMNVSHVDLAEPLLGNDKCPVIQFAGEATNRHHFGTVHGAIESGWREADRLINFYKK